MSGSGWTRRAGLVGRQLTGLPRGGKRAVIAATDALVMAVAFWASFALRLGESLPPRFIEAGWLVVAVPLLSLPGLYYVGVYRSVIRLMGPSTVIAMLKAATVSVGVFAALVLLFRYEFVPRSSYFIYWVLVGTGLGGVRFMARSLLPRPGPAARERQPVVIYGAGMAGVQLAGLLEHGDAFRVVGFLDDDPSVQGTEIRGMPVYGPERLEALIARRGVRQAFLALPSASRTRRREIIALLERHPIRVRTIPGLAEIVSGAAGIDQLREIDADDLLGRAPVPPDTELLDGAIRGRALMVTGAGGSVGAELCRQIIARRPRRIVLYERAEFPLYRIERELAALAEADGQAIEIRAVLGDVLDADHLGSVMVSSAIETVYHAAAYKHVPLVETNPIAGVRTNVFGTLAAIRAAQSAGVGAFVLVSTDKAVHPENVMGASKRLAEMVLEALAGVEPEPTRLCLVRFGNVLDSSGSVVPAFREQIRQGGPITVTHPEVSRYFMTIPEAAQLILQSSAMAKGGDIFVLNMGEPVRIIDLARRMARLSGLEVRDEAHPDGDIEVEYTGLRPGEKLYEELLTATTHHSESTGHAMIVRARETGPTWSELEAALEVIERACSDNAPEQLRTRLFDVVGATGALPSREMPAEAGRSPLEGE